MRTCALIAATLLFSTTCCNAQWQEAAFRLAGQLAVKGLEKAVEILVGKGIERCFPKDRSPDTAELGARIKGAEIIAGPYAGPLSSLREQINQHTTPEAYIAQIERALRHIDSQLKQHPEEIKLLNERAARIEAQMAVMNLRLGNVESDLTEVKSILRSITQEQDSKKREPTYWLHNGSALRLDYYGSIISLTYVRLSKGMTGHARAGDLLFSGTINKNMLTGHAHRFWSGLRPIPYPVTGDMNEAEGIIRLFGRAPIRDKSGFIKGYLNDNMEFNLINSR